MWSEGGLLRSNLPARLVGWLGCWLGRRGAGQGRLATCEELLQAGADVDEQVADAACSGGNDALQRHARDERRGVSIAWPFQ